MEDALIREAEPRLELLAYQTLMGDSVLLLALGYRISLSCGLEDRKLRECAVCENVSDRVSRLSKKRALRIQLRDKKAKDPTDQATSGSHGLYERKQSGEGQYENT